MLLYLKDYEGSDIYFNLSRVNVFGPLHESNKCNSWICVGSGEGETFYLQSTVEDILKQIPQGGF